MEPQHYSVLLTKFCVNCTLYNKYGLGIGYLFSLKQSKIIQIGYDFINKKASIRWQDSVLPISGCWPTSELNAG